MNRVRFAILLVFVLVAFTPFSPVGANVDQVLDRGEFFKLVVEQLDYDSSRINVSLPADVEVNSPYEEAVKVLKSKNIVVGFPDGTFRLDQKITTEEIRAILSRVLAMKDDADVELKLAEDYGVDFGDETYVPGTVAKTAVQKALTSDEGSLKLMEQMTIAQNEQASYKAVSELSMKMNFDKSVEIPELVASMMMDGQVSTIYNKDQGVYQEIVTMLPLPEGNQEFTMVQYFVPEGIFMKMKDPVSGEEQWMNMSNAMPIDFTELMKMNEENLNLNHDLNNKYFIYKDLGYEELDGVELHKVLFSGKIDSIEEVLSMMESMIGADSILTALENFPDMALSMTGSIWVHPDTALPYRQVMEYDIQYSQSEDTSKLPLESVNYTIDMMFTDFGEPNEIVLPEEALKADVLPELDEALLQEEVIE